MPLAPSEIADVLTARVVYAGRTTSVALSQIDVAGAIAVQHVTPQAHTVFERSAVVPRAQDLFRRGRSQSSTSSTERRSRLTATNGVAIIRGQEHPDEHIIINAHADAWFDGAGDNADGLVVLVALARHFARPEHRPHRTLVFVASAGHHSPGLNRPRNFVAMNPQVSGSTVLVLNIEHVAQRNLSPARSVFDDGYREFVADAGEAPIVAGVTNGAPFLENLFKEGVARYGTTSCRVHRPWRVEKAADIANLTPLS